MGGSGNVCWGYCSTLCAMFILLLFLTNLHHHTALFVLFHTGFDPKQAPLHMRGKHLSPQEFHNALEGKNTICLDVRNFNESLIGKFVPPGDIPVTGAPGVVTDMLMRRSTDFPKWVDNNRHRIDGKKVLLYCTAGVRCERASAFLRNRGVDDVYQLVRKCSCQFQMFLCNCKITHPGVMFFLLFFLLFFFP